jgi:hypothetical protein
MFPKLILILGLLTTFTSYSQTGEIKTPIVGNDRDIHGCIASAGYTFSIIKNDCVKLFEQKYRLIEVEPKQSYTTFAAVIFSKNNQKAELFVPSSTGSIILSKKKKKGVFLWENEGFVLSKTPKFELKKDGVLIYKEE